MGRLLIVCGIPELDVVGFKEVLHGRDILALGNLVPLDALEEWMVFELLEGNALVGVLLQKPNQNMPEIVRDFVHVFIELLFYIGFLYIHLYLLILFNSSQLYFRLYLLI